MQDASSVQGASSVQDASSVNSLAMCLRSDNLGYPLVSFFQWASSRINTMKPADGSRATRGHSGWRWCFCFFGFMQEYVIAIPTGFASIVSLSRVAREHHWLRVVLDGIRTIGSTCCGDSILGLLAFRFDSILDFSGLPVIWI